MIYGSRNRVFDKDWDALAQQVTEQSHQIEVLTDTNRELQFGLGIRDRWIALLEQTIAQGGIKVEARHPDQRGPQQPG